MITSFRLCWLVALLTVVSLAASTVVVAQDDQSTTTTVSARKAPISILVTTQSLGGGPLEGVALKVILPDGSELEQKTNKAGQVRINLEQKVDPKKVKIELLSKKEYELAGSRWIKSRIKGNLLYFLMLYPTDSSKMTLEEKVAVAGAMPRIYDIRRNSDWEPKTEGQKLLLKTTGLLMARRGSLEPWAYDRTPMSEAVNLRGFDDSLGDEPTPTILVKVVDSFGNARAGRVVELFSLDGENQAYLAGRGRTDRNGTIYFRHLDVDGLYRILCPEENDDLTGKSGYIKLADSQVKDVGTIVLRESGISGIITNNEAPMPLAKVMVIRDGRPLLTTKTDEYGYFALGPVTGSRVDLAIESPGVVEKVTLPVVVTTEDQLIPFDLMKTVKKQPAR